MTVQTRLSAKGQVVIPKDVRAALGIAPGQVLDVVQTGGGIFLKPVISRRSTETFEEITARIHARTAKYKRPGGTTLEQMDEAIAAMWANGGPDWDK